MTELPKAQLVIKSLEENQPEGFGLGREQQGERGGAGGGGGGWQTKTPGFSRGGLLNPGDHVSFLSLWGPRAKTLYIHVDIYILYTAGYYYYC